MMMKKFILKNEHTKCLSILISTCYLLHQPDIAYSYIVEVKYARRDASDADIALLKRDAAEQLRRYATDEKVLRTKGNTRLGLITLVFKGWELVVLEKL